METLRTRPSPHYLTPTHEEMRGASEKVGLKRYSPSLLADLANIRSGGEILSPDSWRSAVERQVADSLRPEKSGNYSLANGSETKSFVEAAVAKVETAVKYHSRVCDFLRALKWNGVPGNTPLEQSANLLKLLSAKKGGEPSGEGETLPIFEEDAGDKTARELADVLDEVESLDKDEKDLLDPDEKENTNPPTAGSGQGESLHKMRIAEDFLSDRGKREMLRISRQLDTLSRMRVARETKFTPDPEGDDVRNRAIKNLGEVSRMAKPGWATYQKSRTYFWYQAVSGQLNVRERGIRSERKQLLYIIIDCSGSMEDTPNRIPRACGVLMNRLKAVLKGDAELYFRFFDTRLHEENHVSTSEEAKRAMEIVRNGSFSGGGTAIDSCARKALERIAEITKSGKHHKPELVIVSDGGDSVRLVPTDLGETKLHAFLVECDNRPLTDLAIKSGGVGIDRL